MIELTPRQLQCLEAEAEGLSAPDTAKRLGIGVQSVKTHRKEVIRKLEAKNMVHAVALGLRAGVIE